MALTSLQVCMDSTDWLQGTMHDDITENSSSSPSAADILTCSGPLIERRLRPPQDTALKCPRCDSTRTKFCYYNNYSLSQPRYFCKTCRRYWTKGGTLRNIPVGGGCRKNKKLPNKKSSSSNNNNNPNHIINSNSGSSTSHSPTHLQLSFPEVQFSHLTNLLGSHGSGLINDPSGNFMDMKYNALFENPRAIDFKESKYDHNDHLDNSRIISHNFMGNGEHQLGMLGNGFSGHTNFHGISFATPYGMSLDHQETYNSSSFMDPNCHRIMLPNYDEQIGGINHDNEVKPNMKPLALEWQHDHLGCADQIGASGKDVHSFGYGLGTWSGSINGYGSSAENPLV